MRLSIRAAIPFLLVGAGFVRTDARDLTFEQRLVAQRAIERVYYSHQSGVTEPFDEVVPREVLERKVKTYLEESAALESFWRTSVSAMALRNEMERIARSTRFPDRLREMYTVLGNDPFLVQECLARATLVDRWAHSLFAYDKRIHAETRREIEELRRRLSSGALALESADSHRRLLELTAKQEGAASSPDDVDFPPTGVDGPVRKSVDPETFQRWRALAPERPGEIGPVIEEPDAFVIRVILAEELHRIRIASYRVPKRTWDDWWSEVGRSLARADVRAVASTSIGLPTPRPDSTGGGSTCSPTDSWDNGSLGAVPEGRSGAAAIWTGRVMVVWGGDREGRQLQTGGRYDPVTDTWTDTSIVNAPEARWKPTAVWTGNRMVVWGGTGVFGSVHFNSGAQYDPVADSWTPTSLVGAPDGRESHTAIWTGSAMVVWGGYGLSPAVFLNSGGRYDPASDTWTPTSTIGAPLGRQNHTAIWTGSRMVVWGGSGSDGTLDSGGRYDPVADSWSATSSVGAPLNRSYHSAVWVGGVMVVWGGHSYRGPFQTYLNLDTGGRYDPVTDTWAATTTAGAPSARYLQAAVQIGNVMAVWGGFGGGMLDTGGRYNPSTDSWTSMSSVGAPQARSDHTAISTGTEVVVWGGGVVGAVYPDTGGRYNPQSDTWTPTFSQNAPEPRAFPTTVWTGNMMILWGGIRGEEPAGNGGRYDPLTDTWSLTSYSGPSSARVFHTAVWTGSRMIVWGGEPCPNIYDKGLSYDPVSNTWSPIDYLTEPTPRRHHTAVWTGDRMVVWGGFECIYPPTAVATGSRYDPATNSWTPTATAHAPAARQDHTAVWTGSSMLVWGGSDEGTNPTFYNSGGRYDPVADSWETIPTSGAPSRRRFHTAVWTGTSMIVWGGTGTSDFNTGGRYDLATNDWSPTSTTNAPTPRIGHTAVWTGASMIVWGGETSPGQQGLDFMNTGGRYDPVADNWTPTSLLRAPAARRNGGAVWTGTFMVVWGGYGGDGGYHPGNGGRYVVDNPDTDLDGVADVCDCAVLNPGAFSVPGEIVGVRFDSDKTTLRWSSAAPAAGDAIVHDVLRGVTGGFPVGSSPSEICLSSGKPSSKQDQLVPPAGSGFWYLVRGKNTCGTGTYGFSTEGTERSSTACP
jgi:N-acetylneuraminic acid mutarotase